MHQGAAYMGGASIHVPLGELRRMLQRDRVEKVCLGTVESPFLVLAQQNHDNFLIRKLMKKFNNPSNLEISSLERGVSM